MNRRIVLALLIVVTGACGGTSASSNGDPCANGPSEGGCGTECTLNPNACVTGFYCGAGGVCTADCSAQVSCAVAGQSCNDRGRCVSESLPVSDASTSTACVDAIKVIVRDFQESHPDFEIDLTAAGVPNGIVETGIVLDDLGTDEKPVFNESGSFVTVSGKTSFDQWYRDVDGVNQRLEYTLALNRDSNGSLYFDSEDEFPSNSFFPIDGQGFGNTPGWTHNYHFTMELHSEFTYNGGEVFTFTGDDDLFLFINGKLAIDLGGVHAVEAETVNMDALASELGIQTGNTYDLDLFFAERHTSESNFRIETSIECIISDDVF